MSSNQDGSERFHLSFEASNGKDYSAVAAAVIHDDGSMPEFEIALYSVQEVGTGKYLGVREQSSLVQENVHAIVKAYAEQVLGGDDALKNKFGMVYFMVNQLPDQEQKGTLH